MHHLRRTGGRYGMAAMCIGVGQGIAVVIENLKGPVIMSENISPSEHLAQVQDTFEGGDARTAEIMRAALKHLHAFVEEVGLTRDEWFAGIQFLTAVGQKCDDVRQEFILLSDTLGVSMLVEMLNHDGRRRHHRTHGVRALPRRRRPGQGVRRLDRLRRRRRTAGAAGHGEQPRRRAHRRCQRSTCGRWAPTACTTSRTRDHGLDLRGVFTTDDQGRYEVRTVRPVDYTIPDDGPVGQMLRATGRHPWRPAHVHVVASAPGYKPVTTHAFDAASGYLDSDAVFGVRRSLIIDMDGGEAEFNMVLDRA